MSNGYRSTGIFWSGPMGPELGGELNPHHNPHHNPHQNPHHNPHHNPHQNPHAGYVPFARRPFGPRLDPDPIGGEEGDSVGPGGRISQRSSLTYDPRTGSPWPWQDLDPEWAYRSGDTALLALALRKVQARLVGERDVRRCKAEPGKVASAAAESNKLWRWHSEFRQQAVVAELLGHTAVEGSSVYLLVRGKADTGMTVTPQLLVTIEPPGADFPYDEQIDKVLRAASEREERLPEILSQAADFRPFFYSLSGLDRAPLARVDELIQVAWAWATHVLMMLKNNIAEYRPVQRSSLVMPIIATPGHGSLPSGHATIAAMTAHLLLALLGDKGTAREKLLHRLASRIAFNRVVAGVHFPMDSFVGQQLGACLAGAFLAMARKAPVVQTTPSIKVGPRSEWVEGAEPFACTGTPVNAPTSASLQVLWDAAKKDLAEIWG